MTKFIKHSNETRSELGRGKKPARAAPHWVHTSEYSENHLVIPTPHNTHNTSSVTITHHQAVTNMDPEQEVNSDSECSDKDFKTVHSQHWQNKVVCSNNCHGNRQRVEEDLEMFIQPGNTLLPFSSNCGKSRCPLNINHNSSIISKIWIQFWKNDLAAWFMQGAIL